MDPLTGAATAKTIDSVGQEGTRLLGRVLGPSADVLGEALAGWTERRMDNVRNIALRADRKAHGRRGAVNPRVANRILDDGSYVDDEVMAEYYAGILASSKTPDGHDDMGQPWVALVAALSSAQIRLHYVLYRAWARELFDSPLSLNFGEGRSQAFLRAEVSDVLVAIGSLSSDVNGVLTHAVTGLVRAGLIADNYRWGAPKNHASRWLAELEVVPTPAGMDLYGWAVGHGMTSPDAFKALAPLDQVAEGMPELREVEVPNASPSQASTPGQL